jgi:hypothetical protein
VRKGRGLQFRAQGCRCRPAGELGVQQQAVLPWMCSVQRNARRCRVRRGADADQQVSLACCCAAVDVFCASGCLPYVNGAGGRPAGVVFLALRV